MRSLAADGRRADSAFAGSSALLVLFLVCTIVVPKAGVKVGDGYPITLSAIASVCAAIGSLGIARSADSMKLLEPFRPRLGLTVFVIATLTCVSAIEWGLGPTLERAVPVLLPVLTVPWLIVEFRRCSRPIVLVIVMGLVAVAYGGVQLVFGRERTVIPGLTVNYSDWRELGAFVFVSKNNTTDVGLKLSSTYQNGNLYGVLLVLLFALLLARVLCGPPRRFDRAALAVVSASAVLTLSRSALVGCFIVVAFLVVRTARVARAKVLTAIALGVALIAVSPFADRLFSVDPTGAGRVPLYREYFSEVGALGLVGILRFLTVGFGPGVDGLRSLDPIEKITGEGVPFVESGPLNLVLMGGLLLLVAYTRPFVDGWRALGRSSAEPGARLGLQAAMVGGAAVGLIDQSLNLPPTGALLWLILALAFASTSSEPIVPPPASDRTRRRMGARSW